MNRSISLILLVFVWISAFAQDVRTEFIDNLSMVNSHYDNMEQLSVDIEYSVAERSSGKVVETSLGFNVKDGENLYRKSSNTEMITNAAYTVIIEHDAKTIFLMNNDYSGNYKQDDISGSIRQFVDQCSTVRKISSINNCVEYELIIKGQKYDKIIVELDMTNMYIKRVSMFDNPAFAIDDVNKKITSIKYSNLNKNPDLSGIDFTFRKHLLQIGNTIKLTNEFSTFTFYDLRTN
ncbi:MAG: hypothetical protein JXR48_01980 [Candidatus Delongbacteria bacterium]|nr:hypothetical protein [Candidatus Delongbacteria bacterium]